MQELIGKQLGPYRIITSLGSGGMAGVYKAYQPDRERFVAVKVFPHAPALQSEALDRFLQEAQIIARLQHPHIVPLYDFDQAEEFLYIVTPLIEGGSLHDRFQDQPLPPRQIQHFISQIAEALDYAHSQGVIHRDIKLKNILIDPEENVHLTDFGIAKLLQSNARITQLGSTVGTPLYMSPEQIQGLSLDGRSDIYSLGVLMYQLSTGRLPFEGKKYREILTQHLYETIPAPRQLNPQLPPAFEEIMTKALAKKPEDRYATAGEMAHALRAIQPDQFASSSNETAPPELPPPVRKEPTVHVSAAELAQLLEGEDQPPAEQPDRPGGWPAAGWWGLGLLLALGLLLWYLS